MDNIETFLHSLLSAPGLSGYEKPISAIIAGHWRPLTDELSTSRLGSLHGLRRAASPEPRPSLMISTHMDTIGLIVKEIRSGFLFVSQIGGIDPRILPGQAVTVHGKVDLPGIVQMIPDRFIERQAPGSPPRLSRVFVDTGLEHARLSRIVQVGDVISFASQPIHFGDSYISGHSLDNRASVAAVSVCLEELKHFQLQWNLWAVAAVQEELGYPGAYTSTFQLQPSLGIALDVTFAEEPGLKNHKVFPLGKGITIGLGTSVHPGLHRKFIQVAEEMDMPYAIETLPISSGTDAMAMQITAGGIPTIVLGIPIRYMHTPVEMAALADIRRAGRLLARFITSLEANSLQELQK